MVPTEYAKHTKFCYDLMLARLWSARPATPGFLIHDSTIFDGVDECQRTLSLELAALQSQAFGFQYICTLNSDYVPRNEFSHGFRIGDHIRLRLTDADSGGVLDRGEVLRGSTHSSSPVPTAAFGHQCQARLHDSLPANTLFSGHRVSPVHFDEPRSIPDRDGEMNTASFYCQGLAPSSHRGGTK